MHRKIIIVNGIDSENFLNQITTNDIKDIGYGLQYNLLLSPQGKLLHDIFILKVKQDEYWLDCYNEVVEEIVAYLVKYRLGSKVDMNISNDIWVHHSIDGLQDPRHIKLPLRKYSNQPSHSTEDDTEIYYELCLPRLYIDFHSGQYSKGCYIGQEVITRTHHRGIVRKKVYKIISEGELLKEADIYNGQQKIGRMLGIYGNGKGLALLNSELISDDLSLSNQTKVKVIV
jgi:folate-binding protein YgfZ